MYVSGSATERPATCNSKLVECMDAARGGFHPTVTETYAYPVPAWFKYKDSTCTYDCQAVEYAYWLQTTNLGAQELYAPLFNQAEWDLRPELYTAAGLAAKDTCGSRLIKGLVHGSSTPAGGFITMPTTSPDGRYMGPAACNTGAPPFYMSGAQ